MAINILLVHITIYHCFFCMQLELLQESLGQDVKPKS